MILHLSCTDAVQNFTDSRENIVIIGRRTANQRIILENILVDERRILSYGIVNHALDSTLHKFGMYCLGSLFCVSVHRTDHDADTLVCLIAAHPVIQGNHLRNLRLPHRTMCTANP